MKTIRAHESQTCPLCPFPPLPTCPHCLADTWEELLLPQHKTLYGLPYLAACSTSTRLLQGGVINLTFLVVKQSGKALVTCLRSLSQVLEVGICILDFGSPNHSRSSLPCTQGMHIGRIKERQGLMATPAALWNSDPGLNTSEGHFLIPPLFFCHCIG